LTSSNGQRVLAIGIDAAEPTLIRDLIDRGELPTLGALLDGGEWALVESGGEIGSGAVWPTFFTGVEPTEHGMYSGWIWRPERMTCAGPGDDFLPESFWSKGAFVDCNLGVVEVPWAPFGRFGRGFEVSEWAPHDVSFGEIRARPRAATDAIDAMGAHPFQKLPDGPGYYMDAPNKARLSAGCVEGARLRGDLACRLVSEMRPDLAVVVFAEVHHCAHQIWHTIEPDHPLYAGRVFSDQPVRPDLLEVYREVDRQAARLIEAAGAETAVMAFSLHGMTAGPGIPAILEPLLEAAGLSAPAKWDGLSWRDRAAVAMGAAKRRAPERLRRLYHRAASHRTRFRVAGPTIVPPHDWSRTRAFSLPSDQRGFVRINLRDREAQGVVPRRDYDATCQHVTDVLKSACSLDGQPLVRSVLRTVPGNDAPPRHLPDLVVDWDEPAFADPARGRVGTAQFEAEPLRLDMSGQHTPHGFCILDERLANGSTHSSIRGSDLHRHLLAGLGSKAVPAAG
jgi:predicted AlkP superfamily phosphohydrolase/phosphomutase